MYKRKQSLINPGPDAPKNYKLLYDAFSKQKYVNKKLVSGAKGCVLEGSARSRKTFSVIDFIIHICTNVEKRGCTWNVVKESFANIKITLYDEFSKALDECGLPNPFKRLQIVETFKIGKCKINFIGAENASKFDGLTSDYLYINEGINIVNKQSVKNALMRCSKFWIIDYNPKLTQHWIYDEIIPRDDVWFLRTTFRDNPLIPLQQELEILSFEPWEPGSYEIIDNCEIWYNGKPISRTNQPPPHADNIRQGTASEYDWIVFGLGLRIDLKGTIFRVNWITEAERPDWTPIHTLDFGFTNDPTAGTNYWEDDQNIWIEPLIYTPIDNSPELSEACEAVGFKRYNPMICDSADKYTSETKGAVRMVLDLKALRWKARKVSKTKSVAYWVTSMRRKKIHVIKNRLYNEFKKEQENYKWKEINGISLNIPEDAYNHFWDSARYGHMAYNTETEIETEWS